MKKSTCLITELKKKKFLIMKELKSFNVKKYEKKEIKININNPPSSSSISLHLHHSFNSSIPKTHKVN